MSPAALSCRLRWHRWSVWGTPTIITFARSSIFESWHEVKGSPWAEADERTPMYTTIREYQTRQCINCGLVDRKVVTGPPA